MRRPTEYKHIVIAKGELYKERKPQKVIDSELAEYNRSLTARRRAIEEREDDKEIDELCGRWHNK